MTTLPDKLLAPEVRPKVVRACEELIEAEVASKGGLTGTAIKTAFKVVKAVKPGIVPELVDKLLPEFAEALEPLHREGVEQATTEGRPVSEVFASYLQREEDRTADALLSVTDRRAESATNATLKKTYAKLRSGAKQHVRAAIPNVARTVAPFV